MRLFLIIFSITVLSTTSWGQRGTLIDNLTPSEKLLLREKIESNHEEKNYMGYRVRVFRDSGQNARNQAASVAQRLKVEFPDLPTPYLRHQEPYFIVSIGDYRTKDQALQTYLRVKKIFPKAFIGHIEKINPPKLKLE